MKISLARSTRMDKTVTSFWAGEPWKIPGTQWSIIGYSRASYRTGFYIKSLDLMIDAGPQKMGNPKTILVTHAHADHIANIPFTLIKGSDKEDFPDIFVPEKSKDFLNQYISSMFAANFCCKVNQKIANWYPVKGSYSIDYNAKHQNIKISVYDCDHDVPTVSYGISSEQSYLKREYEHLKGSPKELGALRKGGITITENRINPKIVFVWDTTIKILETSPAILDYPVIMIECTFLTEDDLEVSKTRKHIHWNDLKPYVEKYLETTFVLVHFSLRYKNDEIKEFFEKENLPNVKPWI